MGFVSPKVHGVMDYAMAGTMIALPRMLEFSKSTTSLMTGAGTAILGMSLLTRYPLGIVRILPMKAHLATDVALTALLIREGNRLGKKEPEARNAVMGLAIGGLLLTLVTRSKM